MRRNIVRRRLTPLWRAGGGLWHDATRTISAHPRRVAGVGVVGVTLLALVATTTLPMALAPSAPSLARLLNRHDPEALQRVAQTALTAFFALDRPQTPAQAVASPGADTDTPVADVKPVPRPDAASFDSIALLPEATLSTDAHHPAAETQEEARREEIRTLASAIIAVDPLNPVPFRMLAEVTVDPDQQRSFMLEAAKRSRRDRETIIWLLQDDLQNKHYDAAIRQADILLHTQPQLQEPVIAAFGRLAEDADGRPALLRWLARTPEWRQSFFQHLNRTITQADTPFKLMQDLQQMGQPPTQKEVNQYLSFLLAKRLPEYAYNVWVQMLPPEALGQVGFLSNPSFEREPSGGPFDWTIVPPRNAIVEFIPLRDLGGKRAFHVAFGPGRVRFPRLSQTLILPPGRYRLEGKLRGAIVGKRGLLWQVQCLYRPEPSLGQTDSLLGQSQTWRLFGFDFAVPATPDCTAQTLHLLHDARSASEELVSGEVWFDDLGIQRLQDQMN